MSGREHGWRLDRADPLRASGTGHYASGTAVRNIAISRRPPKFTKRLNDRGCLLGVQIRGRLDCPSSPALIAQTQVCGRRVERRNIAGQNVTGFDFDRCRER
jgi:hypothetical protein